MVTDAAVDSCLAALDARTDGVIEATGSESSEADDAVYVVVGDNRAPWRRRVSCDAAAQDLMFIGGEGAP